MIKKLIFPSTILLIIFLIYSFFIKNDQIKDQTIHFDLKDYNFVNIHSPDYIISKQISDSLLSLDKISNQMTSTGIGPQYIVGYVNKFSFDKGEKIKVNYAGDILLKDNKIKTIKVYDALNHQLIHEIKKDLKIYKEFCKNFYGMGCDFTEQFFIDSNLFQPGEYYIEISSQNHKSLPIFFIVKDNKFEDILVVFPNFTWQAYNYIGGGSFYGYYKPVYNNDGEYVKWERFQPNNGRFAVNLSRPLVTTPREHYLNENQSVIPNYHSPEATIEFLKLLDKSNIKYSCISNTDLHNMNKIDDSVKIILFNGHDEYWTSNMRKVIDEYLKDGNNIANFSGNIAWWQSKYNLSDNNIYTDKVYSHEIISKKFLKNLLYEGFFDQFFIFQNFSNTGLYYSSHINNPTEKTFGMSYQYGGYPVLEYFTSLSDFILYDSSLTENDYNNQDLIHIIDSKHEIFESTGFKNGSTWHSEKIISVEVDGFPIDKNNMILDQIKDTFPSNIKILAKTKAYNASRSHNHEQGIYDIAIITEVHPFEGSGKVINFSTIGFYKALAKNDLKAKKLFINSINYLKGK